MSVLSEMLNTLRREKNISQAALAKKLMNRQETPGRKRPE